MHSLFVEYKTYSFTKVMFSTSEHFCNQGFDVQFRCNIYVEIYCGREKYNSIYVTKDLYAVFDIQRRDGNIILTSTCKDTVFHRLSLRIPFILLFNDAANIEVIWGRF